MSKPVPAPFVAAIVHFVARDGSHIAAIVTAVESDGSTCELTIFHPSTYVWNSVAEAGALSGRFCLVAYDDALSNLSWHWPEPAPK